MILEGPYASLALYVSARGRVAERPRFTGRQTREWNDTRSLPLLPTPQSVEVFLKLRRSPRLDLDDPRTWRARPHRELDATNDSDLMDLESERRPRGHWPIYKGESFDIWNPDTESYYGWADPSIVVLELQDKRHRAAGKKGSVFSEFSRDWGRNDQTLPCRHARIVFRDVSRATDTRTVRSALVPPNVVLTNTAPFILWPRGAEGDQALLLGVLCSLPLDWYARRFVETHVNYFVFNPLPIPRPPLESPLHARVVEIAARLAVQNDERFEEWAAALPVPIAPLAADEKDTLIHELDAAVARLYGLDEPEFVHIFETFHEGWDYEERLRSTLRHFQRLSGIG